MRMAGVSAEKPAATRGVVGVGLKRKAQHGNALAAHGAKQAVHHQPGDAVLLPGVEAHHLLPVGGHLVQAVVAAEIHEVEDVFLEAAAAKAGAGLEELGPRRESLPMARATSCTSAPVASQRAAMLLIELMRWVLRWRRGG